MDDDFQACVGPTTRLTGGILDGLKKRIARLVNNRKLKDTAWYAYTDPRIAAIVAGVPFAADFDATSLAAPHVPLAIITARQDRWLRPQFHSDAILRACSVCERLADLEKGGHGALKGFYELARIIAEPLSSDLAIHNLYPIGK